ncbi:uncharacterized protein LOC125955363 [Anopheles darlingi]|uniref:uncharacterized protein LOC125955363 n=1 Tax=Anopheles darlingi TaxID=43151 RepID=UPI00210063A5|nr:uncharacterized protein LOC125955363 [Anopheles darlingi]
MRIATFTVSHWYQIVMGRLKVCFLTIVMLVALLSSSCANPAPRIKTEVKSDKDSDHYHELLYGDERSYQNRVHNPLDHIVNRLKRYFVFGGTLQAIAEYTELLRVGLVQGGAVQYQDRSSEVPGTHAAHVIRVGEINSELWNTNETLFNATRNYIGHTQNVIIDANKFWGIGGELDRFQSSNLTVLNGINFRSTFTVQSPKVKTLTDWFMAVIRRYPMP